jgi:hypothetical protein
LKKSRIILIICSCLFLCSCRDTKAEVQEKVKAENTDSAASGIDFPLIYESAENPKITFNTKLYLNDQVDVNILNKCYAVQQLVDKESVLELLFKEKIKEEMIDYIEDDEGNKEDIYYYTGTNGGSITIGSGQIFLNTPFFDNISNCFDMYEDEYYNADQYSLDVDLPFMKYEDAISDIEDTLSKIGLDVDLSYKCYALDYETLQRNEVVYNHDGDKDVEAYKESWSEEDNCYYFVISQEYKHIPIYDPLAGIYKRAGDYIAPIKVLYSKNGIEMLEINKVFKFEEDETQIELVEFSDIANTVEEKYGMLLTDPDYVVTDATLYYMPQDLKNKKYNLIPVWIINVNEASSDSQNQNMNKSDQTVINAITAEEVP